MGSYSETLKAHLGGDDVNQGRIAEAIGKSQASVSRYAKGIRFPDADTARAIERATDGAVPFVIWQGEALVRAGITPIAHLESAAA